MQFLHPEFFYALPALLIPIFIHLFQLRRFKIQAFTNVALLQKIRFQTRKSSRIKKWLILVIRLLAIGCIITVFSQPFFSNQKEMNASVETVFYLDNSFSMQALGSDGTLFKRAVQDLISGIDESEKISVFTNEHSYKNTTLKDFKNKLLETAYSQRQLTLNNVILKGKSLFSKSKVSSKNLVLVSDFQKTGPTLSTETDTAFRLVLVPLKPLNNANTSIDAVSVEPSLNSNYKLNVTAKTTNKKKDSISITLFEGNKIVGKSILEKSKNYKTSFLLQKKEGFKGKLSIEDSQIYYDDHFYFNIPKTTKIAVLSINENSSSEFLKKLYSEDEFIFQSQDLKTLDYGLIKNKNLIILNSLSTVSVALKNSLNDFMSNGGIVLMIPSSSGNLNSYNQLISTQTKHQFNPLKVQDKSITGIEFNHPVFKDVFKSKVTNFQYPKVKSYYPLTAASNKVLSFENKEAFLSQFNALFVFTAAIDVSNSNFTNSALIVPTLYNIGRLSLKGLPLHYWLGEKNTFDINLALQKDRILKLSRAGQDFIPIQTNFNSKIRVTTSDLILKPGHYAVVKNNDTLTHISYNFNRKESYLSYYDPSKIKGGDLNYSLSELLKSINSESNVTWLWKWFAIFALILLAIEMLILKYFK